MEKWSDILRKLARWLRLNGPRDWPEWAECCEQVAAYLDKKDAFEPAVLKHTDGLLCLAKCCDGRWRLFADLTGGGNVYAIPSDFQCPTVWAWESEAKADQEIRQAGGRLLMRREPS